MCRKKPVGEEEVIKKNMALAQRKDFTAADMERLPEEVRAELIDGQIYYFATPKIVHQRLIRELSWRLEAYIKDKGGECEVLFSPVSVRFHHNDRNYLEPDIVVICDKDKIHEDACYGPPDLVIEIVSLSTKRRDYGIKMLKYRTAGVREYWIVNPMEKNVTVYWFEDESENCQYSFDEEIAFHIFPEVKVRITDFLKE